MKGVFEKAMNLFKGKTKGKLMKAAGIFLAVASLMGSMSSVAFAAEEPTPKAPANGEKIWSVDPFSAEYSSGYFCVKNATGHGCKYTDGSEGIYKETAGWYGSNSSYSDNIYIDYKNGACMNGTYYDVRDYVWQTDCSYWLINANGANHVSGTENAQIHHIYRFYEAGTLGTSNPKEVTFKGVMRLQDMDINEGYTFHTGLKGVWLNKLTHVVKTGTNTWKGTWENGNTGNNVEREYLWVEVEGTPSNPLKITYWGNATHGSGINYYGSSVTYKLVENNKNALPADAKPAVGTHCATYSTYNLMKADAFKRYQFSGWYNDSALKDKAKDTIMLSSDMTFYGTYIKVAGIIETEVVNGKITPSDDCFDYGGDKKIEYSPNEGYLLKSVTVDGKEVDPAKNPAEYIFANVQDDHKIKVVYEKPSMDKEVNIKDSDCIDNYEDGEVIDGFVIKENDVVTYTVAYSNTSNAARQVVISDEIPAGAFVIEETISDKGVLNDNVIAWGFTVPANTSGKVSFDCKIKADAQGKIVKNTADVTFKGFGGTDKDVTLNDTVTSPILPDPVKYVVNADGQDITNKVVNDGAEITYCIKFVNPAEVEKAFTITDEIPAGVALVDEKISDGGKAADGKIIWNVNVAAGQEKTVTFTVSVDKPSKELTKIFNQAKVSVDKTEKDTKTPVGPEGNPGTPVYVLDDPKKVTLNVDGKVISHDAEGKAIQTVKQAGDTIEYQISFQNPATDAREFTITDTLPKGLKFVSADNEGAYNEETRTVTWKVTVESDEKQVVSVKAVIQKAAEDTILKNQAKVTVDDAEKDTNIVETPVIPTPEKDVFSKLGEESINTMPVQVGENLFYTVTYKNPSDETKTALITDKLPEGVKFVEADNGGTYNEENHTVSWSVETEAHAEVTVSVKVKVTAAASGTDLNNGANVKMDEADINTISKNGPDEDETTTNFVPGKVVLNADGEDINKKVVAVGDVVTYQISYKNPSNNIRKINIIDTLPQDVTYVEASDGGKVKSIVHGQSVVWELEVEPKTEGAVSVSVKVTEALKGQAFANSATVQVIDETTGQEKTVKTNQVINYVMDDVVKAVRSEDGKNDMDGESVEVGTTLKYEITVKNPAPDAHTFTVTDELAEGLEFVSADHDGKAENGVITWTIELEGGKSETVSFLAKVTKDASGKSVQNIADVTTDGTDASSNRVKTNVNKPDTLLDDIKDLIGDKDKTPDNSGTPDNGGNGGNNGSGGYTGGGSNTASADGPKTGDDSNVGLWTLLAAIAGLGAAGFGAYAFMKRRKKEDEA